MATPYSSPRRLAVVNPVWIMLAVIALLAFSSTIALLKSGFNELLVGLLSGAWICVLIGLTFTLWKQKELS